MLVSILPLLLHLAPLGTYAGYLLVALVSLIGARLLSAFYGFFCHWGDYRQLTPVSTMYLMSLQHLPFVKFQITTRGLPDSTAVIRRGIQHLLTLVREAPEFYGLFLSIEVVTEAWEQKQELERAFAHAPLKVKIFVVPPHYETPRHTQLKARALHYMVELRRRGLNRQPGQTFIVHFDEDSVMLPAEVKKLLAFLAKTRKRLLAGPVHYALSYRTASALSRAMQAHPIISQLVQCDRIAKGRPPHLHGSNLVLDEQLENALGWDFGMLEGQPFLTEDFLFGMFAFCTCGPTIFGWHGCVLLEQPPFAARAAWQQRLRWMTGQLQSLIALRRMPEFRQLSPAQRVQCVWGTRYGILTAALGLLAGILALLYACYQAILLFVGHITLLPFPLPLVLTVAAFLWLNALFIGACYNLSSVHGLSRRQRALELLAGIALTPLASLSESAATCWSVLRWLSGKEQAVWQPIPKSSHASAKSRKRKLPAGQPSHVITSKELAKIEHLRELRAKRTKRSRA
jgi:hypothetical protein